MNLIELQRQYCNEHFDLEPPESEEMLKTKYELHRIVTSSKHAFKTAYSALRASMNATV